MVVIQKKKVLTSSTFQNYLIADYSELRAWATKLRRYSPVRVMNCTG